MNELLIRKVAFGNFTYVSTATNATNSVYGTGGYLPKGAMVTAIRFFQAGAVTIGTNYGNGTFNIICGGQSIGTTDRKVSEAVIQTALKSMSPYAADGVYISVGGPLIMYFASTDANKTGIAFDVDVYIDYIYCADRDTA
jgi:hypothetical protein